MLRGAGSRYRELRVRSVLLLATTTGYQIRSFGDAARVVDAALVFASDRCDQLDDPWWDHAIPVRFIDEQRETEVILTACAGRRPDAVIAVGDRPTVLAALVSTALGLPGNPPAAARRSRNKLEARSAFRRAGLLTPEFRAVSLLDDPATLAAATRYPAVLKPLALSGSRGVMRVNDAQQFVAAFERLRTLMAAPDVRAERDAVHDLALIESFIAGSEYAVEGVLTRGVLQPLAIFDKPDRLDGPFFEETVYVTPSRQPRDVQDQVLTAVAAAARALELHHGPIHAECRVSQTGVYVLEVAARPIGGLCSKALRFERANASAIAPTSLEELLLRHALGEDVSGYRRESRASGVMMIPIPQRGILRGVEGIEAARRVANVDEVQVTAKPDSLLVPLPEGRSYLGFIFAHGDDAAATERSLRNAHSRLRFVIEREIPVT